MTGDLLISCDLGWATDLNALRRDLLGQFADVHLLPLGCKLEVNEYPNVTHWITDPAPLQKITKKLVQEKFPSLVWIGSPSTGTTHICQELLADPNIRVVCLRDIPRDDLLKITSSSEHTFFLFMSLVRKSWLFKTEKLREWRDDLAKFRGRQISGMRLLIFGYGRIGKNLAYYLGSFGAHPIVYDKSAKLVIRDHERIQYDQILDTLKTVDGVFLCFHWAPENDRFFDKSFLESMRPDSYLINTSRGENLDEEYMLKLLVDGKFSGVGLDVLSNEQSANFRESRVIQLAEKIDRLLVTPHIAGSSIDSESLAFKFILRLATD